MKAWVTSLHFCIISALMRLAHQLAQDGGEGERIGLDWIGRTPCGLVGVTGSSCARRESTDDDDARPLLVVRTNKLFRFRSGLPADQEAELNGICGAKIFVSQSGLSSSRISLVLRLKTQSKLKSHQK